jgi:uncharacterized protein YcfJ
MKTEQIAAWGLGVLALIIVTAGASALVTREAMTPEKAGVEIVAAAPAPKEQKITWNDAPTHDAPPPCNDGNIVGKVLGGVGGGVVGSQIGSGSGQTVATIGGTLGGAYLGGEYTPTENVTCR